MKPIIIAASDAPDDAKAQADLICTGANDQAVIQAALDSLAHGGDVALTEGTFNCDGPIDCDKP